MSGIAFKISIFFLLTNIAMNLTMLALVDIDGNNVFDDTSSRGYDYKDVDSFYTDDGGVSEFDKDIQPSDVEESEDKVFRLLDLVNLGLFKKIMAFIDTLLYGFVNLLEVIIGDMLSYDVRGLLFGNRISFGIFKIILSILYIVMGVNLFTNRDVKQV
jgi:hypothetical protein